MIDQRIKDFIYLALAAEAYTPFYLLDLDQIKLSLSSFIQEWQKQFRNFRVAYSYKSNSLKAITQTFAKMNISAEIVSGSELQWALEDGFEAENIFFDGPLKTREELELANEHGVNIQIDSLDELNELLSITKSKKLNSKISLRLSAYYRSVTRSRFGLLKEEAIQAYHLLERNRIPLAGIHIHLGSNLTDSSLAAQELNYYKELILFFLNSLNSPIWLDIGGGFPAKSVSKVNQPEPLSSFIKNIESFFHCHQLHAKNIELIAEPGRCLVEDHGYLVTSVHARKQRNERHLLIVDGGIHLVKSVGSWHHPIVALSQFPHDFQQKFHYDIYGSNCFESDLFIKDYEADCEINKGDFIVIGSAGGYDIPSANAWIRPLPAIYGILNNEIILIRHPQSTYDVRIAQLNLSELNEFVCSSAEK